VSSNRQGGWHFQKDCQGQEAAKGKRNRLIFLPRVAVNQATISIAVVSIATIIKATDGTAMTANLTIIIETIDATIALNVMTRT
jgi:hypothetical protein